ESSNVKANNVTNTKSNRVEINETIVNKEKNNKEEITNTANHTENIEKVYKNTENINERNKINIVNTEENINKSLNNTIEPIYIRTTDSDEHRLKRLEEKLDKINKKIDKK
ncbi:hypothetical protein, partial [Caldisalinibacter kiritimatiensis]|uniref:hypothetical protein n=1 Tax=Caldisalinibacter kiritimatiensis TaxID=1304284 RepID=UPI000557CA7F